MLKLYSIALQMFNNKFNEKLFNNKFNEIVQQ